MDTVRAKSKETLEALCYRVFKSYDALPQILMLNHEHIGSDLEEDENIKLPSDSKVIDRVIKMGPNFDD